MTTLGSRYVQLLQGQPDPNNGTIYGGLASALQKGMMGYAMGQDERLEKEKQGRLTQALQMYSGSPGNTITWNQQRPDGTGDPTTTYGAQAPDPMGAALSLSEVYPELSFSMMQAEMDRQRQAEAANNELMQVPNPNGDGSLIFVRKGDVQPGQTAENAPPFNPDIQSLIDGTNEQQGYFGRDGNWVPMGEGPRFAPSQAQPYTDAAQAAVDLAAGFITQEQYEGIVNTPPPATFKDENSLRDEYTNLTENYREVATAYQKVEQAAQAGTPAGDISLVFAFMKMIDPGSTVREGEAATVQNARAIPDWIRNIYNQTVDGVTLTPAQRMDFLGQAQGMFQGYEAGYQQTRRVYTGLAENYGLDPNNVVLDYSYTPEGVPPPTVGDVFDGHKYMGGAPGDPNNWEKQ